jgi:hypothetical protein
MVEAENELPILPFLIGIVELLLAISFCIPSYVHQQLLSLDCQNFVHCNSLVFFTYLGNSPGAGFSFSLQVPSILSILLGPI